MNNVWPLIFKFNGSIIGNGFSASVVSVSRLLGVQENDEIWLSGVQPEGIAAGGSGDLDSAYHGFREAFVSILVDIASEAGSFEDFSAECTKFFEESDGKETEVWQKAVEAARRSELDLEVVKHLPKLPASLAPVMTITQKHEMTVADNLGAPQLATAA